MNIFESVICPESVSVRLVVPKIGAAQLLETFWQYRSMSPRRLACVRLHLTNIVYMEKVYSFWGNLDEKMTPSTPFDTLLFLLPFDSTDAKRASQNIAI